MKEAQDDGKEDDPKKKENITKQDAYMGAMDMGTTKARRLSELAMEKRDLPAAMGIMNKEMCYDLFENMKIDNKPMYLTRNRATQLRFKFKS